MTASGKRLFVGVRVSVATANALSACAETLARRARDAGLDLRWEAPVNYHVTLKFLGWTREDTIDAVRDAVTAACAGTSPFTIKCARLGAFASLEHARILWAGVSDAAPLTELATAIDRRTSELGFAAESRPFHPHVTLARLRETRPLRDVVLPMSEQMFSDTRVDGVTIFESETKSSGSVYKEVHRIGFKSAPATPENAAKRQTPPLELDDETDDGWPRKGH